MDIRRERPIPNPAPTSSRLFPPRISQPWLSSKIKIAACVIWQHQVPNTPVEAVFEKIWVLEVTVVQGGYNHSTAAPQLAFSHWGYRHENQQLRFALMHVSSSRSLRIGFTYVNTSISKSEIDRILCNTRCGGWLIAHFHDCLAFLLTSMTKRGWFLKILSHFCIFKIVNLTV